MSNNPYTDVASLCKAFATGKKLKYVFFWGHTGKPDLIGKECLSQWYPAFFTIDGITYPTTEHYMMAEKARLFGDETSANEVQASGSPATVKMIGRKVTPFDPEKWEKHRVEIVIRGNLEKFGQNEQLKEFLLSTKSKVLVEASPKDRIWGIGLGQDDKRAQNPTLWKGLNLLGFALMEVREKLK